MSLLNLFSDPKLRARQDILDAQWLSLATSFDMCNMAPTATAAEFDGDFRAWAAFYGSESDWSADSFNATNEWQAKAKEWADRINSWGCNGNVDFTNIGLPNDTANGNSGIPGVKPPPADDPGLLAKAAGAVKDLEGGLWDRIATVGWVAIGLVVFLVIGIIYALTHVKVSSPQGSLG